jgi:hypothetical protein
LAAQILLIAGECLDKCGDRKETLPMIKIDPIKLFLIVCAGFLLTGCGIHYTVKGQVVDAVTRQPVQGAVVAVNWVRDHFITMPGLPVDRTEYGTSESVTDADGEFRVPKYIIGWSKMVVYKRGYVCWTSDVIFNPHGKNQGIPYYDQKVTSGMQIDLIPIDEKDFPELKHALFTVRAVALVSNTGCGLIDEAIEHEKRIYEQWSAIQRKRSLQNQRKMIEQNRKREMRK